MRKKQTSIAIHSRLWNEVSPTNCLVFINIIFFRYQSLGKKSPISDQLLWAQVLNHLYYVQAELLLSDSIILLVFYAIFMHEFTWNLEFKIMRAALV